MADKAISELEPVTSITPTDSFVLEQDGGAKRLTGQVLLNWLTKAADGHGGIQSIEKIATDGLADTYRIKTADSKYHFDLVVTNGRGINSITGPTTNDLVDTYTITYNDDSTSTFTVTNGRGIESFSKTGTSGLVDTYKVVFNEGDPFEFTVTNGAKGDTGDASYLHIKYASQQPTEDSHSFGDLPDNWIGVYSGTAADAPTDWQQYQWFQMKGEKGDTGDPATLTGCTVEYQAGDSGSVVPSGIWSTSVPAVGQGKYLWTRTTSTFNTGSPVVAYSVTRFGIDGAGSVTSVCGVSPDADGNVTLAAENLPEHTHSVGDLTDLEPQLEVIWTNEAPDSEFPAQTLTIPGLADAENFQYIMVTTGRASIILPNKVGKGNLSYNAPAENGGFIISDRELWISAADTIVFYDNYTTSRYSDGTFAGAVNNNLNRPHSIVGIRGVL